MGKFAKVATKAALFAVLPFGAFAQSASLADIRAQLSQLSSEIQSLRGELVSTGALTSGVAGATPLERMNSFEASLMQLTAKTEELEYRISRVVTDGTNRIGDLEFRLCELEPGCDIGSLGNATPLGAPAAPAVTPPSASAGAAPQSGEQADFARASEALAQGDFRSASDLFAAHVAAFPVGSLTDQAHLRRAQALEALEDSEGAAASYLESFAAKPSGVYAPDALFGLGRTLAQLRQIQDACITLSEVSVRFAQTEQAAAAQLLAQSLQCS